MRMLKKILMKLENGVCLLLSFVFNRHVAAFVKSIQDDRLQLSYVVTDDGSTDGTAEDLSKLSECGYDITEIALCVRCSTIF